MQWIEGDLIFIQMGDDSDAISTVTVGWHGARLNHMGVLVKVQGSDWVLEAYPPKVMLTAFTQFIERSKNSIGKVRYLVGRLRPEWQHLIPAAIAYGRKHLGIPYDNRFLTDEEHLYCSELVVDMFKAANGAQEFFPEKPMSFTDPATGEISTAWVNYYHFFGMDVPQGAPGSNPGDVSSDPRLDIIKVVGPVSGL